MDIREIVKQGSPKSLTEANEFLFNIKSLLFGPDSKGTVWNITGGGSVYPPVTNYLNYIMQTSYFNRTQRWVAQYLYQNNAYCRSAIDSCVLLVLGTGFEIVADTETHQKEIDDWVEETNWKDRSKELFRRYLTDGEVFLRVFGNKVRFIEPDNIYSGDTDQGILTDEDDYETVTGYLNTDYAYGNSSGENEEISADEVVHWKNARWNEKRGFSFTLPVYQALIDADALLHTLVITAEVQARYAAIRYHEADKQQVSTFRSDIQAQNPQIIQNNATQLDPTQSIEYVPSGSVVDLPKGINMTFPSQGIKGREYVEVLRAILRQVAARFSIPECVLSQDSDSMAAYTAQLVQNSYLVKGMEAHQADIWECTKKVLKKVGFNVRKLNPSFPQIATPDKDGLLKECDFLLKKKLASRCTVAKALEIDYKAEKELIQQEETDPTEPKIDTEDGLDSQDTQQDEEYVAA